MAPQTPPKLVAPRRHQGAPRPPPPGSAPAVPGRSSKPLGGRQLLGQAPDAALGRLVTQRELHERHVLGEVLKDHAHALADGDLLVLLERDAVRLHEVAMM